MNTSRSLRSKRKKAIPHYFQKSHTSLQDILLTASYKRRIKELLKNNKQLALTLQDAKYRAANQQNKIEDYARTTTQVVHARMKLREMVTNLQKLVTDVDEVATLLDVGSFNILKNAESSDVRMRVALPETSTIEESASRSILESDITTAEESSENSTEADQHTCTPVKKDKFVLGNLRSSLARVDSILKGDLDKSQENISDENHAEVCNASISVESPSTPQLELIRPKKTGKLESFLQNYKESSRKPLQPLNTLLLGNSTTNTFVSKIPKVLATQYIEAQDENILPTPQLPNKTTNRRDTFVVPKQSNVPNVFPSAADRRGTFTINVSEDKVKNDRRETYLVPPKPVPPIQELPTPTLNLNVSDLPSANEFPNKTILLCEDMELTEIIPTQKIWSEETVVGGPTLKNKEPVTLPAFVAEDMELTKVVPILKPPQPVVEKANPSYAKNAALNKDLPDIPAVGKPLDDACFPKPLESKSKTASPLHSTSKLTPPVEQKQTSDLEDKAKSKDDEIVSHRKSKKSSEIECVVSSVRGTKSRPSSISKRKSVMHKKSGRFSNAKSKGSHSKSDAMSSSTEPLSTKPSEVNFLSDMDDSLPSDTTLSPSSSNSSSKYYNKYFEEVFKEPIEENVAPGRKVLNFFETRKSLVPNKRVFVFTNSSKEAASESEVPVCKTNRTSSDSKKNSDVFEFSTSDSESPSNNKKHKKEGKKTKRNHLAEHVKGKKESANKKPRSEKTPQHISEKVSLESCNEKTDLCLKKLRSTSESNKLDSKPVSLETSPDSFVIEMNNDESTKIRQLVNLKGDCIFSNFSNEVRKTPSRQCKKSSLAEISKKESLLPKNDALAVQSAINGIPDQSSLDKNEVMAELDLGSKDVQGTSSSRSSKLSGEKGKAKRTFSGISERRSKKKSTLDPSDFFEELHMDVFSQENLPKTADLNDEVSSLDLGVAKVYNCKEMVDTKVQKRNLDDPKQVSEVRKKVRRDDNLKKSVEPAQMAKVKNIPFDEEVCHLPFGEMTEVYNLKDLIGAKSQQRNLDSPKQVSELKKQAEHDENAKIGLEPPQTQNAKDTVSDEKILQAYLGEKTDVYNLKNLKGAKVQKRNLVRSKPVSEEKREAQHDENMKKSSEPPKSINTKNALSDEETLHTALDEKTEMYNPNNLIGAKVQKRNLERSKPVSEEKRQAQRDENVKKSSEPPQSKTAKGTFSDEETLHTALDEKTEVYNPNSLMGAKVQKRNLQTSKPVSEEKRQAQRDENVKKSSEPPQSKTAKGTFSDEETLRTALDEETEVYNPNSLMGAKVQKRNLQTSKPVSEEKRQAQRDENMKKSSEPPQSKNAKDALSDEETLRTSLEENTKVYNLKNLIGAKVQKRNPEGSKQVSGTKKARQDENVFKKIDPPRTKKDILSDTETPPTLNENKKPVKDSKTGTELRYNECEDDLTKTTFPRTETTVSSLGTIKKTSKGCTQELVAKKMKHTETILKKSSQDIIPQDVLCSAETTDPFLSNKKKEITTKSYNKNENKHREKPHKKLVSTQSIKNKTPLDEVAPVPSSNNIKNTASLFDKAEFENIQLDNLSNNDFIPSKPTKQAPKKKATQAKTDNIPAKKSHTKQSSSVESQVKLNVPTSVEAEQDSIQSKTARLTEVDPAVALEPASDRRRNGSGSIVSLYNAESKDQAGGRPSRSTRTTKSFKEPKLNCKMRR